MKQGWEIPAGGAGGQTAEPRIRVKTGASPWNGKVYIRLLGFAPGALVNLEVRVVSTGSPPETLWRGRAVFRADDYGIADISLQEPVAAGPGFLADPLGLFSLYRRFGPDDDLSASFPDMFRVELRASVRGKVAATASFTRERL